MLFVSNYYVICFKSGITLNKATSVQGVEIILAPPPLPLTVLHSFVVNGAPIIFCTLYGLHMKKMYFVSLHTCIGDPNVPFQYVYL